MSERIDGILASVDRRAWGCSLMPLRYNRRDRVDKESGCTQFSPGQDLVPLECSRNDISEMYVPGFLFRDQKEVHRLRRGLHA